VSDHGVMARFPYLDENLVNFLCEMDTGIKCCLDYPRGVGEKLILRQDLLSIEVTSSDFFYVPVPGAFLSWENRWKFLIEVLNPF
jgi:hypothetical protein